MEHVRWSTRKALRRPVLVVAFEGWNDAGDAASGAARYVRDRWNGELLADIDPEDFYDFTATRPRVEIDDDGVEPTRRIEWPTNEFYAATPPDGDRDVVIFIGVEPQLRWRTFCQEILDVAAEVGADIVVTMGALLAEIAHSRPVPIYGSAFDPALSAALGLSPSTYEGPTGIVGVLNGRCQDVGLASASLWAAVPSYVSGASSPKAALALVERLAAIVGVNVVTNDLEIASASYERQVTSLVEEDEDTAGYVARLEREHDDGADLEDDDFDDDIEIAVEPDPELLVEEVERFLRDQTDT